MWSDVAEYLFACKEIWDSDILDDWIQDVRSEHIPDFDQ